MAYFGEVFLPGEQERAEDLAGLGNLRRVPFAALGLQLHRLPQRLLGLVVPLTVPEVLAVLAWGEWGGVGSGEWGVGG